MKRLLMLAVAFMAMVHAGALAAQTPNITQTVRVYDATLAYPPPLWVKVPADAVEGSQIHREQKGNFFLMEQIRKAETFNTWKEMLKISALNTPNAQTIGIGKAIELSNSDYTKTCGADFGQQIFRQEPADAVFVVYCGNTPRGPTAVGYGDGVGEISVNRLMIVKNTIILLQYAWRRPKFEIRKPDTHPISQQAIGEMVKRLQSANATAN